MPVVLKYLAGPRKPPSLPTFDERFRAARETWLLSKKDFQKSIGSSLRYGRVLGIGGFGMAQLWSVLDTDGNHVRDVVIKAPILGADNEHIKESIRKELSWMRKLGNAEHVVQLVYLTDHAATDPKRIYNNPSVDTPYILMEALSRGTLMDLIKNVTEARYWNMAHPNAGDERKLGFIPARILWRIFFCLTRGVTAMAYPHTPSLGRRARELVPRPTPANQPGGLLHMDIDPSNLLVGDISTGGDTRDEEHARCPIVKMADFGLMLDWDKYKNYSIEQKRRILRRGKRSWFTPEQRNPRGIIEQGDTVSYKLNIWAIGVVMLNLMTLGHPDGAENSWLPEDRQVDVANLMEPADVRRIPTWGSFVLKDEAQPGNGGVSDFILAYDERLRNLIARCMCHRSTLRPSIRDLAGLIRLGMRHVDSKAEINPDTGGRIDPGAPPTVESDRLLSKFHRDYFLEPRINEDPYALYWAHGSPQSTPSDLGLTLSDLQYSMSSTTS
ncbi:kinase-like domain-containing protein [Hypoxylon cercidicola]|nr:kinase-like domain-containing protein [Hypoxylon cercidicola]